MLHRRLQYRHRHCNQQLAHLSAFNRYPKCSLIPFHTPMSKKKETVTINDSQKSLMLICSTARFSICSFTICDTLQQKKTKEKRKEKSNHTLCTTRMKYACVPANFDVFHTCVVALFGIVAPTNQKPKKIDRTVIRIEW